MATPGTPPDVGRLHLSDDDDEDTNDLWDSPSTKASKARQKKLAQQSASQTQGRFDDTDYSAEELREAALKRELESVRNINQVIEGVVNSLERARGNMDTVSRTVNSASALLNTWTRILSQTEHNQRLILDPTWQGATQDLADIENEAVLKQQAAERRALEIQQRREAAARQAEEEERRKADAATSKPTRGSTRGRGRGLTRGRAGASTVSSTSVYSTPNTSSISRGSTRGIPAPTRRAGGFLQRGSGLNRGRARGRGASSDA